MRKRLHWRGKSSTGGWKASQVPSRCSYPWLHLEEQMYGLTSQMTKESYNCLEKLIKKARNYSSLNNLITIYSPL